MSGHVLLVAGLVWGVVGWVLVIGLCLAGARGDDDRG